jgi:hypothetical protein
VTSQGCADIGVCYAAGPDRRAEARGAFLGRRIGGPAGSSAQFGGREVRGEPGIVSDEARFEQALVSGNFLLMLAVFFGAGILLAFTPCVLPMVPILSGIIIGEGRAIAKAHAFALSLTYVLGMALTYTVIGILAALSGTLLSATLQNPWVLGACRHVRRARGLDVRLLRPAAALGAALEGACGEREAARRRARRGRPDGDALRGDREPVRRRAARRGAPLHQPDA